MKKIVISSSCVLIFLLASCSPKLKVASSHFESSDTLRKDTTLTVKPKPIEDEFNFRLYCDTLFLHETIIKTEKGKISVIVDSSGIAHLHAENDSLKLTVQNTTINHTTKDTIYVQTSCDEIKHDYKSFKTKVYIGLGLLILAIGVFVGVKVIK